MNFRFIQSPTFVMYALDWALIGLYFIIPFTYCIVMAVSHGEDTVQAMYYHKTTREFLIETSLDLVIACFVPKGFGENVSVCRMICKPE